MTYALTTDIYTHTRPNYREGWADYFESHNIQYAFFSAANGIAIQEERARLAAKPSAEDYADESDDDDDDDDEEEEEEEEDTDDELANKMRRGAGISMPGSDEAARTRILSVAELENLFLSQAPAGKPTGRSVLERFH